MNKLNALLGVLVVLLIGLTSAALSPFLSNTIESRVGISGPVFYTSSDNELLLNKEPNSANWNQISDGTWTERSWIMSDEDALGGVSLYNPKLKFIFDAEIASNFSISEGVGIEFGFYNTYDQKKAICSFDYWGIDENKSYTIECPDIAYLDNDMNNIDKFYYSFEPLTSREFRIKTKYTYAEIIEEQ